MSIVKKTFEDAAAQGEHWETVYKKAFEKLSTEKQKSQRTNLASHLRKKINEAEEILLQLRTQGLKPGDKLDDPVQQQINDLSDDLSKTKAILQSHGDLYATKLEASGQPAEAVEQREYFRNHYHDDYYALKNRLRPWVCLLYTSDAAESDLV